MEMRGNRTLGITQSQAWDALNDADVLKSCIPGCDKFEQAGNDQYAVGLAVKIGPVSAKFNGKIMVSDVVPPVSYTIAFEGQGGAAGFGKGRSTVHLTPRDQGCDLDYAVSAQVGGKVAQLGQRLIDGAAKAMADDFFGRFEEEIRRRYPTVSAMSPKNVPAGSTAPRPSGFFEPKWIWAVAIVALVFGGIWALRSYWQ